MNPPLDLIGKNAVISVEPSPDTDPTPYALKPLAGLINTSNPVLNNIVVAEDLPSAVVNIVNH